ncbi:hypothetical protein FV141_14375 (plasmid) [Dermacoccus abyssi]|uniref:DUF4913 domain-containing protein n=1 Tax=Dermacoccus abyssi TaxID=322596 RepID=A0ABX5ZE09_9MICO|nr:hypothetical protein FV141_14375 [Dermacoccus abyssi]
MSNIPAWGDESLPDDYGTSSAPAGVSDADANEVHAIARELLDETHALLSRVGGTEAALEEVMTYLADMPAGGAWCWRYLDPYERVALFTELREWVDWMSDRYKVRQLIRPCWFKHAPVVEELTGLYVAWRSTFKEQPRAYNDEIIAFHDRWFWPLMRRIEERKFFNTCDGRQHKESEVAMPGTNMDDFTPDPRGSDAGHHSGRGRRSCARSHRQRRSPSRCETRRKTPPRPYCGAAHGGRSSPTHPTGCGYPAPPTSRRSYRPSTTKRTRRRTHEHHPRPAAPGPCPCITKPTETKRVPEGRRSTSRHATPPDDPSASARPRR